MSEPSSVNGETTAISMLGIVKRFPGVLANDHVDLEVKSGEIHTLLGENGAGKSTLMNILSGLYAPDEGEILLQGKRVEIHSPRDAIRYGIGTVYQHFMLVDAFTVTENIILGMSTPRFNLRLNDVEQEITELSQKYGLRVDPKAKIWQLSVGEQQRVEILKMLYRGAEILILDEPTAVLTPPEVDDLFVTLRRMKEEGKTILFISHKLDEVMQISDSISVLRDGKKIADINKKDTNPHDLACMMVGREVLIRIDKKKLSIGQVVLETRELCANNEKGLPALKGITLDIRAGEILGVAGVAGNGQRELAEVITGLRQSTNGSLHINNKNLTNSTPKRMIGEKVSHIPEDRLGVGLIPSLSVGDNMILKNFESQSLSKGPFLLSQNVQQFAQELIKRFGISTPGVQTLIRVLSGGNQQKALLAREINTEPKLMIAVHPTRGLDIGATANVRELLINQRENGTALLLISEDLDEVLQLSDRIAVLYEGEIKGIFPAEGVNIEQIGMLMAGVNCDPLTEVTIAEAA
jgi:simple sugar transport system ATP-binding protein